MAGAKTWLVMGAFVGAMAVSFGAFGAHKLPDFFEAMDFLAGERAKGLKNWETAAQYQMYHALALLALGLYATRRSGFLLTSAGYCFFFGQLIFSGCLYALVLSGVKLLGAIVPIGGVLMILGWIQLGIAAWCWETTGTTPSADASEAVSSDKLPAKETNGTT